MYIGIPDLAERPSGETPPNWRPLRTAGPPNSWRLGRSAHHQLGHGAGPGAPRCFDTKGEVKIMEKITELK